MSFVVISGWVCGVQSVGAAVPRGCPLPGQPLLCSCSPEGSAGDQTMLESLSQAGRKLLVLIPVSVLTPQLFEIRPIWSRNAVKANISIHPDKLKVLLPFMAYYMVSACPASRLGSHQGRPDH